jgi:ketosteroid isomerase-like protein
MSQENVEVVREGIDALNKRDPDAFMRCLHPDVVWEESGDGFPGLRGVYRGRAEAREWFKESFLEAWEELHLEIEEITQARDGRVFLEWALTARGRATGVDTELRGWNAFWFEDGKIARRQVLWTRDEALEAGGLSE